MSGRDRELERRILDLTDRLIEVAMALGLLEEEEKQEKQARAREMVEELAGLVSPLLEGRQEHLDSVLWQLVQQKLPGKEILKNFGGFSDDLGRVLEEGLEGYKSGKDRQPGGVLSQLERELEAMGQESPGSPSIKAEAFRGDDGELPKWQEELDSGGREAEAEQEVPPGKETKGRGTTSRETPSRDPLETSLRRAFPGQEVLKEHPFLRRGRAYFLPGLKMIVEVGSGRIGWSGLQECLWEREGVKLVHLEEEVLRDPRQARRFLLKHI